ncbi:NAD-dependent epimerase/dehydratase family protein [Methanosphaera cuniculi]|uniref:GDP-mannose 4,6-dehydratase n=1 Tax=Methanosphaera cuniculi TaxID=1077256 RepID=A0A2A2HDU5_9EURY|nr:NAD-dependent epimerase/dehydratase family protein [Methanosphaera cuniculi]PAV07393.1 GDP-mannose 4,6-dehydratase [Methanosphaera cuniculi]PWL07974.1 UDP-glucose 4-epimerase [Methanosphaera cuniculi]
MNDIKCVVTGGAGFIGSHITETLIDNGVSQVTIIDNMTTGNIENLKDLDHDKIQLECADITTTDLKSIFLGHDYVFHEAALISVPESIKHPTKTNEVNINGSYRVLKAACESGIKKVISASSAAVYGETDILPNTETLPLKPLSPYAVSKSMLELYSYTFTNTYNLPTACLRYFNVFGPRQNSESAYSGVIPKFISALINDKQPIIYGDGEQTRDFIYVKNIAKANYEMINNDATGIFNIAHGKTTSINQLLEYICEIMGYDFNPKYMPRQDGDIINSVADISKAEEEFGFKSEHDFKKELKETINYYVNTMQN